MNRFFLFWLSLCDDDQGATRATPRGLFFLNIFSVYLFSIFLICFFIFFQLQAVSMDGVCGFEKGIKYTPFFFFSNLYFYFDSYFSFFIFFLLLRLFNFYVLAMCNDIRSGKRSSRMVVFL